MNATQKPQALSIFVWAARAISIHAFALKNKTNKQGDKKLKVLHTADWHLGKKLNGISRLAEQKAVLEEIAGIADKVKADVIIAAGDIFDTFVPSSEAEELFYDACVKLSKDRIFIALAGNHDDALRLAAPKGLAKALNVFLVGGYDNAVYTRKNVRGGDGFIKIEKGGEVLNIAIMPYPQHSKLADSENREQSYAQIVKDKLDKICLCFNENEFNMLTAHLFLTKSGNSENLELTDERELGTAAVLPSSIIPSADFTALGHIHKPMTVAKSQNIYYSGSILPYSYDDINEKSVLLIDYSFDTNGKKSIDVQKIGIKAGRRLIKVKAENFSEAINELKENKNTYAQVEYNGLVPLTLSEVNELKKQPSFNKLINNFKHEEEIYEFKERTEEELFVDFYKRKNGQKCEPKRELVEMFLSVMNGEDIT